MFDTATLGAFIGMSLLLALAPGPDNLFVLTQSILRGPLVGIIATLGMCTGLLVHTAAVALGLAVLIKTSAIAFLLLKILGASYLLYLAWGAFLASGLASCSEAALAIPLPRFYLRGILMSMSNPKVSLFFLAFLPQFSDPGRGSLGLQLLLLGLLFMVSALLVFVALSLLAGVIGESFRRSARLQRGLNLSTGLIFAGLAIKLLLSKN